jgi:putative (di)nucleoside polyphosphate hydrolase
VTDDTPGSLPYRPCVGVMLARPDGRIFVGRRIDTPEAWQMPQGGIDPGETPEVAALRELGEEIGTSAAEIVASSAGWYRYDLPPDLVGKVWGGRWRGQEQRWVLCRFTGRDEDIDLATHHPEFDAWRWVAPHEAVALIVPFKREIYAAVTAEFAPHLARIAQG